MAPLPSRLIRLLLVLYIGASLGYYVANLAAIADEYLHLSQHIQDPFELDFDNLAVTKVSQEAAAAGLQKGDRIEGLAGQQYRGEAQWMFIDRHAHPGDVLAVDVRGQTGSRRHLQIRLRASKGFHLSASELFVVIALEFLATLICLVIGYWVVLARPRDANAWLILVLLSFPEVLFSTPSWWSGAVLMPLVLWYQTLQVAGPLVVLLIGIYFPERWRLDRRLPWFKWLLLGPQLVILVLIWIAQYGEYFQPALGPAIARATPWIDRIANPVSLLCVIVYWVALLDKLRSASTADARRRMRVLCAGSVLGLGSLLIIFVLLRNLGIEPGKTPWLSAAGAALSLLFPFSLAYVVVVQRAMDVRLLLRMGTKYVLARATLVALQIGLLALFAERILSPLLLKKRVEPSDFIVPLVLGVAIFVLLYFGLARKLQRWLDRKFFREAYTSEIVLSELSEEARRLTEAQSLISTIARRISEILHVPQIAVLLRGGRVFHLQQSIGFDMLGPVTLRDDSTTVRNLVEEKRPATLYRDHPDGWFAHASPDEQATLNAVNAEVLLPLPGRGGLMGFMTLGPKRSEEPYSPSDLRLLQSVGAQTGLALEVSELAHSLAREAAQRERFNRELEIAREVQERLFPQSIPELPGIGLAGACRPAQGVGGDYYDFIELETGRLGLAIGDVSGKGISAALLMASLRASLRGMTLGGSNDLAKLMRNVNQLVYEASANNRYATFFFGTYDPGGRELRYVNAGHNPPFILRDGGCTDAPPLSLDAGGPVVGLLRNMEYQEGSIVLQPGDVLLAYTDGISEAMTTGDEEWGEEAMIKAAENCRDLSAHEMIGEIMRAADAFTGGAPQHDDMTLLVMKVSEH